jgi:hypothetical protein
MPNEINLLIRKRFSLNFINLIIDEEENQLDATQCFIAIVIGSTYFGHHYAHRPEVAAIPLITSCAA